MSTGTESLYDKNKECYMIVFNTTTGAQVIDIPCYPDEISDSINVGWSDHNIINRSSPLVSYVNTGVRSVSFTITLHREMYGSSTRAVDGQTWKIERLLKYLRASMYPKYEGSTTVRPPIVAFVFGSEFKVKGVVKSMSYTWKKPIIDGKYYLCDVNVSVDQYTEGPFSVSEVVGGPPSDPFQTAYSANVKSTESVYSTKSRNTTGGGMSKKNKDYVQ